MIKFQNEKNIIKNIRSKTILSNIFTLFSFFMLLFISIKLIFPELIIQIRNVNATSQTSEQTVGSYTLSMSNDTNATIDITPTSSQQVFTASNDITLTNTCPAGATISIETNSSSSNALERVGSDNKTKTISATTGTSLNDNSWGFSLDDGETYRPVPTKNSTSTYIYDENSSASNTTIPILYGVKTNNALPSGNYNTDIVYTANVKAGCLTYAVTWDLDGGTGASGKTYPTTMNFDQTINLSELTPTKSGFTFTGWSNGTDTFNGDETDININEGESASITMTAQWLADCNDGISTIGGTKDFNYTGTVQTFNACAGRQYKLEVWGAQSIYSTASYSSSFPSGNGAYAKGTLDMKTETTLYVYVGGRPYYGAVNGSTSTVNGGYNGGGASYSGSSYNDNGPGGGATDISLVGGECTMDSYKRYVRTQESYLSRIIVAGGGGGGRSGSEYANGGYSPSAGTSATSYAAGMTSDGGGSYSYAAGGFGYGASGTSTGDDTAGGGGGWYGGGSNGDSHGGGGSSFVWSTTYASYVPSNYSPSVDYQMSDIELIRANTSMPAPGGGNETGHSGNGYARITYLGTSI